MSSNHLEVEQREDDYTVQSLKRDIKEIFGKLDVLTSEVVKLTTTHEILCPERKRQIDDNADAIKNVAEELKRFITDSQNDTKKYGVISVVVSAVISTFMGAGGLVIMFLTIGGGK